MRKETDPKTSNEFTLATNINCTSCQGVPENSMPGYLLVNDALVGLFMWVINRLKAGNRFLINCPVSKLNF